MMGKAVCVLCQENNQYESRLYCPFHFEKEMNDSVLPQPNECGLPVVEKVPDIEIPETYDAIFSPTDQNNVTPVELTS